MTLYVSMRRIRDDPEISDASRSIYAYLIAVHYYEGASIGDLRGKRPRAPLSEIQACVRELADRGFILPIDNRWRPTHTAADVYPEGTMRHGVAIPPPDDDES